MKDPDPSHSSFWKHEIALRVCSASIRRPQALAEQTMHHSWAPGHHDGDISAEAGPPLPEPSSLLAGDIVSHPSHVLLSPPCSISDVRGHEVHSAPRTTSAQVMRQLLSPSFTLLGLTLISPEGQVTDPQQCGTNTGQRMVVSCCKCPGSERHAMEGEGIEQSVIRLGHFGCFSCFLYRKGWLPAATQLCEKLVLTPLWWGVHALIEGEAWRLWLPVCFPKELGTQHACWDLSPAGYSRPPKLCAIPGVLVNSSCVTGTTDGGLNDRRIFSPRPGG